MQAPTKTIETPIGKHKVEIREWITGRQREYVNEPLYGAVDAKPQIIGGKPDMTMGKFDIKTFVTESDHREFEVFVVSVDGQKEIDHEGKKLPAWEAVLEMHEDDTAFVKAEIDKIAKKNETPTTS